MNLVRAMEFKPGSREELLPDFDSAFPCITSRYLFPENDAAPWHWHGAMELFYIESGCLEYVIPESRQTFHTGSGGLLMSNIPHMTRGLRVTPGDTQLLHLFDPVLISGQPGSRIEREYMQPLMAETELIALDPTLESHRPILDILRESFLLCPTEPGYEILLRESLSRILLLLFQLPRNPREQKPVRTSELIRQMMIYVHGHYAEKLTVADLARAACISERVCYTLFQKHMNMTPMEYVTGCRIRTACRMLSQSEDSITTIAAACGFSSASHFSQIFHQTIGISPRTYRKANRAEK